MAFEPQARFGPNSYGFRPGRSCGDAIAAIYTSINKKDKYVLEADIHKFFDQVNHEARKLETFPQIRRQITPWLEAEILDRGEYPE